MAAFDFPNSPNTNDTHTENGVQWKWNGSVWKRVESVGEKGQKGEDNSTKGQKGEVGADNSTKGQKGEVGASGAATINNNADNKVITGSNTSGELNAESGLTYGSNTLTTPVIAVGDIKRGTNNADVNITFEGTGKFTVNRTTESRDTNPHDDSTYDLGTSSKRWRTVYADTFDGGGTIPSGTRMLFNQTSAPTGWTKDTSSTNRALRLVSGTVGTGGVNTFTGKLNASVSTTGGDVHNRTLSTAQMPQHKHEVDTKNEWSEDHGHWKQQTNWRQVHTSGTHYSPNTNQVGETNQHDHGFTNPSFNLNIAYTDVIIAEKD
tara:strand:- start:65 stop:1024 length:960 start_codon:yes stop_codon:yes gene_type:complete